MRQFGFHFFVSSGLGSGATTNTVRCPFIYGTVVSSALALLIAVPLSLGVGLCLTEMAPEWISRRLGFLVELLAAIPSVVYGLWAIFVLGPWLRDHVEPGLGNYLGFLPFFQGPRVAVSMLNAGVVLAIMVLPYIAAVCTDVFRAVPQTQSRGGAGAWRDEVGDGSSGRAAIRDFGSDRRDDPRARSCAWARRSRSRW